jgi:hypothetical protein
MEGVSGYNAFTITHGCNGNVTLGAHRNVIAQSVVFPNSPNAADTVIYRLDPVTGVSTGVTQPDLSADIYASAPTSDVPAGTLLAPGEGIYSQLGIGLITAGGTLFPNIIPSVDTTLNIRGYRTWSGPYPHKGATVEESVVSTTALSPWRYGSKVVFRPTSCAKSLKVRIAIANWCRKGLTSVGLDDRVDLWIGHTTDLFNDQRTMPRATAYNYATEVPFWPTFTIKRDLIAKPLNDSCGAGYDLAIEPSSADIDKYLTMPAGKYPNGIPGGTSQIYYP